MDSPVVERRSRKIAREETVTAADTEGLNDDEEELREKRQRHGVENALQRKSIGDKILLSESGMSEHVQSCIQLAAENKITAKNAFNFKLIDLLHVMLTKKKSIKDFTEVSHTLDAGVKIYSCRVDNVHADTLKMATSIHSTKNKGASDEENVAEEGAGDALQKKSRNKHKFKVRKTTIAAQTDQINRSKPIEQEEITHKILSNEKFITDSAIFDSKRVCWHLNASLNFWKSNEQVPMSDDEKISIKFPVIRDDIVICPTFANFRFDGECTLPEISTSDALCEEYNYEPPSENESVFDDVNPVVENFDNESHEELSTEVEYFSKIITSAEFVTDISQLITSEKSDYLYFNSQMLKKNWNMKHWNPFKRKKQIEPRETRESRRVKTEQDQLIDFDSCDDLEVYNVVAGPSITISAPASREKFLITPVTHFNMKEFFRLNVWQKMYVVPNTKTNTANEDPPSDLEDNIKDYNYNNPNDSQHYIPELHEDDYREDNDSGTTSDVHDAMEKCAFMGDNLIDIPNKVSKIQLPYMVKDKSVNMKKLKSKMWDKISEPNEQVIGENDNNSIKFKNLCQMMLTEGRSKDEELSVPILFNAILQLANDKNLYLFNPAENNISDFLIKASN